MQVKRNIEVPFVIIVAVHKQ